MSVIMDLVVHMIDTDEDDWSASRLRRFTPQNEPPGPI